MNTTFLFWEQGKTCNKVVIKNYCINSTHLLLLPLLWSDSLTDPLQTRDEVRGGGVGVLPLTFYNFLFCFSFFLFFFSFLFILKSNSCIHMYLRAPLFFQSFISVSRIPSFYLSKRSFCVYKSHLFILNLVLCFIINPQRKLVSSGPNVAVRRLTGFLEVLSHLRQTNGTLPQTG